MRRNKYLAGISFILLVLLLGTVSLSTYFYRLAVAREDKTALAARNNIEAPQINPFTSVGGNWINAEGYEVVDIQSHDGMTLKGYHVKSPIPTGKTAILVHGYSGHARTMHRFAQFYYESLGYNVLLPDLRGHGLSDGNYIGFGWHDRKDLLGWIDFLIKENPAESIVLHGVSMGGAAVLMASGEQLPPNVEAVISDSAYTSAKDQIAYQMWDAFRLPAFPLLHMTSLITKIRAGFYLGEASSVTQVQNAQVPILLIHGENDSFVPTKMAYQLYPAINSEKELFIVEGAEHGNSFGVDNSGYQTRVARFLADNTISSSANDGFSLPILN